MNSRTARIVFGAGTTLAFALCAGQFVLGLGDAPRTATFEVREQFKINVPENAGKIQIWCALPQENDPAQQVADLKIEAPFPHRTEKDSEGNTVLYLEADKPAAGEITITETFVIIRKEVKSGVDAGKSQPLSEADRAKYARYLEANTHVVIDDRIRKLAAEIVGDEKNTVRQARKLYDWTLENVEYWVKDPKNKKASPVGSTTHCLDTRTGNCTDFHSLWTSLARASGIPTRMIYGSFFKQELDGQDTDQSYHCWPEFYVPGTGWVPHDVAVADIFYGTFPSNPDNEVLVRRTTADGYSGPDPAKVDYYFGNIDERRVTWSTGRDLVLMPKPAAGPINALPKAHIEVDGKPLAEGATNAWTRKLTYKQKP
ncbi:MAG: transglutaminase-like domain-containing protein [Planctomycetota bacterium]